MGHGEFGGGGSVVWEVKHGNGHSGSGGPNGGKGKDKDPAAGSGGQFTVFVNGAQCGPQVPVDTSTVLVTWTGGSVAARKRGTKAKGSKKR